MIDWGAMNTEKRRDWTAKELAAEAKVGASWIRQLLIAGDLRGYKRAGAWFIPDAEARRWLEARRRTP